MVAPLIIAALIGGAATLASGIIGSNAASDAADAETQAAEKALGVQVAATQQSRIDAYPWALQGAQALYTYMDELGIPRPQTPILPDLTQGPFGTSSGATGGALGGSGSGGSRRNNSGGSNSNNNWTSAQNLAWTGGIGSPGSMPMTQKKSFQETPGYQFQIEEGEKGVINNLSALGMKNSGAALKALTRFRSGLANAEYGTWLNRIADAAGMGQVQTNQNNANLLSGANGIAQAQMAGGAARASGYVGGANAWTNALGNFSNNMGAALGSYDQNWKYQG